MDRGRSMAHGFRRVLATAMLAAMSVAGCKSPMPCDQRHRVDAGLQTRTGHSLGPSVRPGETVFPAGVAVDDGVTEDEAVAIALWNNAAFGELLTQLGVSRAQLYDAGLLQDPNFTVLFPVGPKQLEFTGLLALDALWLRPIRVRAAGLDLSRVAEQMVQNGLNVVRDARVAHADLVLAQERVALTREVVELRTAIAGLAERRLEAGDIGELEATTARIDVVQARAVAVAVNQEVPLAQARFKTVLGLALSNEAFVAVASPVCIAAVPEEAALVSEALASRPDLRAAEIAIEAAGERAGLARAQFMQLSAIVDANAEGVDGFEIGPGAQFTIPIFNGNRGQAAIARANLRQAARAYVTVRDRIALEVRTARTQFVQARENLAVVEGELLPELDEASSLARRNYEAGATDYLFVLQTTAQYLDVRNRNLDLHAALRRAASELERSVGRRCLTGPPSPLAGGEAPPAPASAPPAETESPEASESEGTEEGNLPDGEPSAWRMPGRWRPARHRAEVEGDVIPAGGSDDRTDDSHFRLVPAG